MFVQFLLFFFINRVYNIIKGIHIPLVLILDLIIDISIIQIPLV